MRSPFHRLLADAENLVAVRGEIRELLAFSGEVWVLHIAVSSRDYTTRMDATP